MLFDTNKILIFIPAVNVISLEPLCYIACSRAKIIYENIGEQKVVAVFITFSRRRCLSADARVVIIICVLFYFNMRAVKRFFLSKQYNVTSAE